MVISGEAYLGVNVLMDLMCLSPAGRLCHARARPARLLLQLFAGPVPDYLLP